LFSCVELTDEREIVSWALARSVGLLRKPH
jgi:hypothetical protein